MARKRPYNLTNEISALTHLLVRRVPALSHIQCGRVLHGISQARNRKMYGVFAQCYALRFRHGAQYKTKNGQTWVWPTIRVGGQEILYYITYLLPRYLDMPPRERLTTLIHELWHISPQFNGDLRRFQGRNEFHGSKSDDFDGNVERMANTAEHEIDLTRFAFLNLDFEGLNQRYDGVVGAKLKRFRPRRHHGPIPTNLGITPIDATRPQRSLF